MRLHVDTVEESIPAWPESARIDGADSDPGSTDTVERMEVPELVVADAAAWQHWLRRHHGQSPGVWLVLAKKGTVDPTALSYDQALDEAICFGWIDGQTGRQGLDHVPATVHPAESSESMVPEEHRHRREVDRRRPDAASRRG